MVIACFIYSFLGSLPFVNIPTIPSALPIFALSDNPAAWNASFMLSHFSSICFMIFGGSSNADDSPI